MDWSYELLFDDERRLFNRLSVFGSGCDVEAAIGVCSDEQVPAADVPDLMARLVDKSVLVADHSGPQARFTMLQTLEEYGTIRLADSGHADHFRTRHRHWFTELAGRSYAAFKGEDQRSWLRSVETDMENLRAALGSAVEANDAESALVIAGGLGWFWQDRSRPSEGLRWLRTALASEGEVTPATKSNALVWQKILSGQLGVADPGPTTPEIVDGARQSQDAEWVAWAQVLLAEPAITRGDLQGALDLYEPARDFFARQPDAFAASLVAFMDANAAQFRGDRSSAERLWAVCAARARETGSIALEGLSQVQMSNLAEDRGDYEQATACVETAIRLAGETGTRAHDVSLLVRSASLAELVGDQDRADSFFTEAAQAASDAALRPVLARALSGLAVRHRHAGRLDAAEVTARRALALHEQNDFEPGVIGSLCLLGFISELRGDAVAAQGLHRRALDSARQVGDPRAIALCLEGLAGIALFHDDTQQCATLLGAAAHLRDVPGVRRSVLVARYGTMRVMTAGMLDDRSDAERIEMALREKIGADALQAAMASGADQPLESLVGS
jgi:tetratricopeptide (TPR) repeat protein